MNAPYPKRDAIPNSLEYQHDDYYEESNYTSNEDIRIVNGYAVEKRPWIVQVNVAGGLCGGALINHK